MRAAPRVLVLDAGARLLHLRRRRREPVPSLLRGFSRAGDAGRTTTATPTAGAAGARHRPVQPLGSRPAPGAEAGCSPASAAAAASRCSTRLPRGDARRAAPPDAGRRVQGTGADAAGRDLHRRAAATWSTRSASTRCAKACAQQLAQRACATTGNGPAKRTRTAAPTRPTRCPPAAARWRTWRSTHARASARAKPATRCGPARPTSASRTPPT